MEYLYATIAIVIYAVIFLSIICLVIKKEIGGLILLEVRFWKTQLYYSIITINYDYIESRSLFSLQTMQLENKKEVKVQFLFFKVN